jgi:hypothetical protein
MTTYNLKSALDDYRITKFDADMNVESSYLMSRDFDQTGRSALLCECPAGVRPSCRHRQMLPDLLPLLDTEYFWDFERHTCVDADGVVCDPIEDPAGANSTEPATDEYLAGVMAKTEPAAPPIGEISPALDLAITEELAHPPADIMAPAHWRRI